MNNIFRSVARWGFTIAIVAVAIAAALLLWGRYETDPWTRDGHVRTDILRVAPDVGGLVTQVAVRDNQTVRKGQLLFVVDLPRYADTLDRANATIASARATLAQAGRVARRDLALGDLVAAEAHEQNLAQVETARAAVNEAIAAREAAALDVHRTAVRASVNGIVTNLDLHPGDFVGAGSQALALVDIDSIRVEGYFEETKLRSIHAGDHARIRLMGDDRDLQGHVESITAAIADDQSSEAANQLRQVQPTFSWVRLAQRIPVRIHIDSVPAGTELISGRTATILVSHPPVSAGTPRRVN